MISSGKQNFSVGNQSAKKKKLDAGYPESIKDMFDVIVDMSNVGRTFTPDIFVHQCCQRSLHIFSVMRCIKDS